MKRRRPSPRRRRSFAGTAGPPETIEALIASLGQRLDDEEPSPDRFYEVIDAWAAERDEELGRRWARPGPDGFPVIRQPECQTGCCHCCYQIVAVTEPEAALLARHLRRFWSAEDLDALRRRLAADDDEDRALVAAASTHEAGRAALARLRRPCPLLDEPSGLCRAYEARPVNCRRENSVDVEVCRRYRDDPDQSDSSLRLVRLDLIWSAVPAAIADGGVEPLAGALRRALDDEG